MEYFQLPFGRWFNFKDNLLRLIGIVCFIGCLVIAPTGWMKALVFCVYGAGILTIVGKKNV